MVSHWEIVEEHQGIVKRQRLMSSRSFGRSRGLGEGTGVKPLEKVARLAAEQLIVRRRVESKGEVLRTGSRRDPVSN